MRRLESLPAETAGDQACHEVGGPQLPCSGAPGPGPLLRLAFRGADMGLRSPVRPGWLRSFRLRRPLALLVLAAGTAAIAHAYSPAHGHPSPGYLGVSLVDLDPETATRLHLKDTHGALVASIDRDAPAAAAGLRPHDVIVEASGHKVDSVEALRRRLRGTTAGTTLLLRISREGAEQSIPVRLGDESEIEERAWNQHFHTPEAGSTAADPGTDTPEPGRVPGAGPSAAFAPPTGNPGHVAGFLGRFSLNSLYTGADFDPLSTQLADYFGVHDGTGLLVRTVNENSPAWQAGLRAGDVVLRVNSQPVVSREDWTKQIRANRGRPVQLSVMRNRREQTLAMSAVGEKK